ncbi:MAG: CHAT domain-containing tetratricopeptide repeat protein [Bacteroidales bacterium]
MRSYSRIYFCVVVFLLALSPLVLRAQGDRVMDGVFRLGAVLGDTGRHRHNTLDPAALNVLEKNAWLVRALSPSRMAYDAYKTLGRHYKRAFDVKRSLCYAEQAATLAHAIELPAEERTDLMILLGHNHLILGNYAKAGEFFTRGLTICGKDGKGLCKHRAALYTYLGRAHHEAGSYDSAWSFYSRALEVCGPRDFLRNVNLLNMAELEAITGDYEASLAYYGRVLDDYRRRYGAGSVMTGIVLNNIGLIWYRQDKMAPAREYFERAYGIFQRSGEECPEEEAAVSNNLGDVFRRQGDYRQAGRYYHHALALCEDQHGRGSAEYAFILNNVANLYRDRAVYDTALHCYRKVLENRLHTYGTAHDEVAQVYRNMGRVYLAMNAPCEALAYFDRAVGASTYGSVDALSPLHETAVSELGLLETLLLRAETTIAGAKECPAADPGRQALADYYHALDLAGSLRCEYTGMDPWLRVNGKISKMAGKLMKFLLRQPGRPGHIELAFELSGRSRNYALWASMQDERSLRESGVPATLIRLRQKAEQDFLEKKLDILKLAPRSGETPPPDPELFARARTLDSLNRKITGEYPVAGRAMARPATIKDLRQALDKGDLLLEYYYDSSWMCIMAISRDTAFLDTLQTGCSLEVLIRRYLRAVQMVDPGVSTGLGHALYEMLLGDVPERAGPGITRLIIIPYQDLFLLPFETLVKENPGTPDFSTLPYVIRDYTVQYHYSASLFLRSLQDTAAAVSRPCTCAGFAPFVQEGDVPDGGLHLLARSGQEVERLGELCAGAGRDVQLFTGLRATEGRFKSMAERSGYMHVAGHGYADPLHPRLNGLLFHPDSLQDGILHMEELFALDTVPELVVLSACNSGAGAMAEGEGMLSLVRGFLYSGVGNILVSVFSVPDRQTQSLMEGFYGCVMNGGRYGACLRESKLGLISDPATAFPVYWGGFVFIGAR